jgi:peptidoglycan/xylan/chitin deacetylase (PgdA/CDA1 family)
MPLTENRAVSALFRVFGAEEESVAADAREISTRRGMHLGEFRALAVLVPLTLWVAIADGLSGFCGWGAWWLALPATLVVLTTLPLVLFLKTHRSQWLFTLTACLVWAFFQRAGGGTAALLAHVWIGIGVLNLSAFAMICWERAMRWSGVPGIVWRLLLVILPHAAVVAAGMKWGWPWALASGAVIAAVFCRAVLDPGCQWLGPVYRTTANDEILITIDDGPDPRDTPVLLDLLDRHRTKAIFFMIGEKVRAYPELAREVLKRGHEIGNHTMTHPQGSFWCAGPWRTWREIEGGQRAIKEATGENPRLFRAPVGHRNLFTHPVAALLGLEVMAWNRRGYDAVAKDAGKVLAKILPDLSVGDIVLLHEATPIAAEVAEGVLEARRKALGAD